MGFFDMFSRKGPGAIGKHAARVANKRAQNPDRWESIQVLGKMGTPEAVQALLTRFEVRVDPSIVDQEEKDAAFNGIISAGETAVDPIRAHLKQTDKVSWPLKMLEKLLSNDEVVAELLSLLEGMTTDYERDPDKKIQVVAYLEDRQDERIVPAVMRFLEDANETVRFHAVGALFAQEDPSPAFDALMDLVVDEESVRVRVRSFAGLSEAGFKIPEARRDAVRKMLPEGFALDQDGTPRQ
jgi:HEAT repeat protein